jgi:hypothetical protein
MNRPSVEAIGGPWRLSSLGLLGGRTCRNKRFDLGLSGGMLLDGPNHRRPWDAGEKIWRGDDGPEAEECGLQSQVSILVSPMWNILRRNGQSVSQQAARY